MLRRLGFKASLSALIPGGRRSFSVVTSNFPFANEAEGFKNRVMDLHNFTRGFLSSSSFGTLKEKRKAKLTKLFRPLNAGKRVSRAPSIPWCHAGVDNSIFSSSEKMFNKGHLGNVRPAMALSKQALAFPRHQAGVVENIKPSLSNSFGDDDFAELGPSLSNCVGSDSDMAEEKLKDTKPAVLSLDNASHQSRRTHMQHSAVRRSHRIPQKEDSCQSNFSAVNQNDVSRNKNEAEKQKYATDNNQGQTSISIDKVPSDISLQNLREAVLVYGEIVSASLRSGPDRLTSCHIKFKSIESKERALATQWITIRNCRLPVRNLYIPEYITIRVSNINMETAETAIHSMCISCGDVAGLARAKEGAVDVIFRVKDSLAAETILKRLNNVYYDDCQWSAHLVPKSGHNSSNKASASQWSVGSQINNLMGTFRKQFQMQRIYLEDLEDLHYAVLHLRDRPTDMNSQKAHDG